MSVQQPVSSFWRDAFAYRGSVTPKVLGRLLAFGAYSWLIHLWHLRDARISVALGPLEVSGAAVGVLLVLRLNAGYDRWWEARKLWGGIVNQSRNLVIAALAYGPKDAAWRGRFVRLATSFAFVARSGLRGERAVPELPALLGDADARAVGASQHPSIRVASLLARELEAARAERGLDGFAFLAIDRERALLLDHLGGCERILRTPMAAIFTINVRRFIALYLFILPFALVDRVGWMTPLAQLFVAYPLLTLDQIADELQNPFRRESLGCLPLDQIAGGIGANLLAIDSVAERDETAFRAGA